GQLARSWKFMLMINSLVDELQPARRFRPDFIVGRTIAFPADLDLSGDDFVIKPDGSKLLLGAGDAASFRAEQPGIYRLSDDVEPTAFAVNLDPLESRTGALATERFEQLGCLLTGAEQRLEDQERLMQLRDVELERRQKIWKWLVAAALTLLVVETLLAGRLSRAGPLGMSPAPSG
ncbi:MAG: hypothetical protein AAF961_02255, partial [Planctomycetota bacterium]